MRSGFGVNDTLDLVLEVIATIYPDEEVLWTDPVIALVMSKDQDSTNGEYITIQGIQDN